MIQPYYGPLTPRMLVALERGRSTHGNTTHALIRRGLVSYAQWNPRGGGDDLTLTPMGKDVAALSRGTRIAEPPVVIPSVDAAVMRRELKPDEVDPADPYVPVSPLDAPEVWP